MPAWSVLLLCREEARARELQDKICREVRGKQEPWHPLSVGFGSAAWRWCCDGQAEESRLSAIRELQSYSIESGDYQVQVHVIEAREIRPKDLNGLSDPVVCVEALGQKKYTAIVHGQLSCVFDEVRSRGCLSRN